MVGIGCAIGAAINIPEPETWQIFLLFGAPLTLDSINAFIRRQVLCKTIEKCEVQIKK